MEYIDEKIENWCIFDAVMTKIRRVYFLLGHSCTHIGLSKARTDYRLAADDSADEY